MNVFFISDLHLGHRRAAEQRGYEGRVEQHDATLMWQWESYVRPRDQVWVLGDLCSSSPAYALSLIKRLPGEKHLILGNHDRPHPMHRNSHRQLPPYLDVFASVQMAARRKVAGHSVLLSHFPYTADHTDVPRHMQYRLPDRGELLLHGHTHSSQRYTSDHEMHVGVDAWDLTPVPLEEVEAWVRNQVDARELNYPELTWTTNFEDR